MSKEQEDISSTEENYSDDDDLNGINLSLHFPAEAYQLTNWEVKTSTPQISPNISPESAPKPGIVQAAIAAIYSSEANTSYIADRTRNKDSKVKQRKMGKITRLKKTFNTFKEVSHKLIKQLEDDSKNQKFKDLKAKLNKLISHRILLEKDIVIIRSEEGEEDEQEEITQLQEAAQKLLLKITTTILDAEELLRDAKKPMMATGKLTKIEIPKFYGDYLQYRTWQVKFLLVTSGCDEPTMRIYLIEALKDKAYEYVEDLIIQNASLEKILEQLETHFGNEHYIIDESIKSYFELPKPEENVESFETFFIQSKNRAANLITLGHSPEQLLAAYFMLQIPGKYRSELEKKLSQSKEDRDEETKYTFAQLAPLVEEFTRIMKISNKKETKETTEAKSLIANTNVQNTIVPEQTQVNQPINLTDNVDPNSYTYNYIAQQTPNNSYNRGRGYNYNYRYPYNQGRGYDNYSNGNNRSRGNPRGSYRSQSNYYTPCLLCGDTQHWFKFCQTKPHGKEMRDLLKSLNMCDACLTPKDMHGVKCIELRYPCKHCKSFEHETITCDGYSHPGSWIKQ